jgi:hypothetical protein
MHNYKKYAKIINSVEVVAAYSLKVNNYSRQVTSVFITGRSSDWLWLRSNHTQRLLIWRGDRAS